MEEKSFKEWMMLKDRDISGIWKYHRDEGQTAERPIFNNEAALGNNPDVKILSEDKK